MLNLLSRLIIAGEMQSQQQAMEIFGDEFVDVMKLVAFTSLPELLNTLLENDEGLSLLTLLGAVILGAEVDGGGEDMVIRIKSASKNFEIALPIENITSALWVNIQSEADGLKKKLQAKT